MIGWGLRSILPAGAEELRAPGSRDIAEGGGWQSDARSFRAQPASDAASNGMRAAFCFCMKEL